MKRRAILALGLQAPAVAYAGLFSDTYRWRQKLTMTVMTPEGIKTGAAVTAISVTVKNTRGNLTPTITGEATAVEVAPDRYLFALLSGQFRYHPDIENTHELAELLWRDVLPAKRHARVSEKFEPRKEWKPIYKAIPQLRGAREMPVDLWPAFAAFEDLSDPRSVRVVTPDLLGDVFGPGVSIQSITLEITDDPPTDGVITAILPWITGWKDVLLPVPPKGDSDYTPEERIRGMNFKRES